MPPFPGARPRGFPVRSPGSALPIPDVAALAAQIGAARVGGDFWNAASDPRPGDADAAPDPWERIGRDPAIAATPDEELALLAAAAGRPVIDRATGAAIDRGMLLARLGDAIAAFRYFDPWDGQAIDVRRWIEILAAWRALLDDNRDIGLLLGISAWKRPVMRRFFWSGVPARVAHRAPFNTAPAGRAIAIWPSRVPPATARRIEQSGRRLYRMEDGFLRSAGLGVLLNPPYSILLDRTGIPYDPRQPSDLERLLAHAEIDAPLRARAARLIRLVTGHGVTKYAAGLDTRPMLPAGRRCVLVVGQVEDDCSVRAGGAGVSGNLDLLRRARAAEPDAFLVYKPHPDVASGLRKGHVADADAARYADTVARTGSMHALLTAVDAVHVLTSLAGFEALLRGREVITHGQPFYAGWGLTRDLAPPIARRGRVRSLEELVAATLILYPRYLDPETMLPCPPEVLVARLSKRRAAPAGLLQRLRAAQGRLAIAHRTLAGALR